MFMKVTLVSRKRHPIKNEKEIVINTKNILSFYKERGKTVIQLSPGLPVPKCEEKCETKECHCGDYMNNLAIKETVEQIEEILEAQTPVNV